jgi:hypothetical protein
MARGVIKTHHPANKLFKEVEDKVVGVSCGCADVFGASPSGFDFIWTTRFPEQLASLAYPRFKKKATTS